MKKICLALIILFITAPALQAATLQSEKANRFTYHKKDTLELLTITAEADQEITAEHGIRLMLDANTAVLWEESAAIQASGLAVNSGKMAGSPTATYSDDYKSLLISVSDDFSAGESVVLEGIQVRTYQEKVKTSFFKMDIDGDMESDGQDWWDFSVSYFDRDDHIAPYPIYNFQGIVADDLSSVTLTWKSPLDWDFRGVILNRVRLRDGITLNTNLLERKDFNEFVDIDVEEGDEITYQITALDTRDNFTETVTLTLTIGSNEPEPEEEEVIEEPAEEKPVEEEMDLLDRLFNYYKVRQAIKCRRDDSACLWTKINLIYAQEKLDRSEVEISLSERDLYLMGIRIRFTEDRYQKNCVEAETPAKTCNALGRSIKRARYFLDKL